MAGRRLIQSWKNWRCYPKNKAQVSHLFDLAPRTNGLLIRCPYLIITVSELKLKKIRAGRSASNFFPTRRRGRFILKNDSSGIEVKIFGNLLVVWRQTIERDEWAWLSRADIFSKTS